jgi:hypothetical protein
MLDAAWPAVPLPTNRSGARKDMLHAFLEGERLAA